MAKEKAEKFTSPRGIGKYVWLKKPDTKFKKEGQFKITLEISEDAPGAAEMKKRILAMEKQALADAVAANKGKKDKKTGKPIVVEASDSMVRPVIEDEEVVDGKFEVTFKTTASGVNKKGEAWERSVPVFDSKGKPTKANVGSGSVVKVSYSLSPYFVAGTKTAGVTAYLEAVQVIDLKEFSGSQDAEGYGFEAEEDGYEAGEDEEVSEDSTEESEEQTEEETSEESSEEETEETEDQPEEEAPKPTKGKKSGAQF